MGEKEKIGKTTQPRVGKHEEKKKKEWCLISVKGCRKWCETPQREEKTTTKPNTLLSVHPQKRHEMLAEVWNGNNE